MEVYPYEHDRKSLEIFPKEIWQNPRIVFHGTSSLRSASIERNGFTQALPAYDTVKAEQLVALLKTDAFSQCNISQKAGYLEVKLADDISQYLYKFSTSEDEEYVSPVSFSVLSSYAAYFASKPHIKGGQGWRAIRNAKRVLSEFVRQNPSLATAIPPQVTSLFDDLDAVESAKGVVYAVLLPNDLQGMDLENSRGIIQAKVPITAKQLIGKVIVQADAIEASMEEPVLKEAAMNKFNRHGGLGQLAEREPDEV
jgi:hypothetical protein